MIKSRACERGTTLAIALILLFIVTLVATSSIKSTQMQEKMAHNTQDKMLAFQAAEAALKGAENLIESLTVEPIPTAQSGCPNATVGSTNFCIVTYDPTLLPETKDAAWWASNASTYTINYPSSTAAKHRVTSSPYFYIQFLRFVPDSMLLGQTASPGSSYYRIYSRGTGLTGASHSVLETTYKRRY